MLSRALSLATVTLLIGCFAADPAQAQATNLEAGKSPSQIFAGTCTACHKSPRGLLKTVPAGSLPGFLQQHYTTSPEMASLLAAFLVSNGASRSTLCRTQSKPGKDEKSEAKPGGLVRTARPVRPQTPPGPAQETAKPEEPKEAAKPEPPSLRPQGSSPDARAATPDAWRGRRGTCRRGASTGRRPPASAAPMAANCRPSRD